MDQKQSTSYPLQFAILIGLMGIFIVMSALVVEVMGSIMLHVPFKQTMKAMNAPENADTARLLNTIASLLVFVCPAIIYARIVNRRPLQQLGFNTRVTIKQFLIVIAITFTAMVLGGALGDLNEKVPLPTSWYNKAKELEDTYKAATLAMARMHTPVDYIIALVVLAAFPALCEELIFRGALQPIMVGWTRSKWTGIIITSILFSAFHFSYFGFLPRAVLGIVLGLVFYSSRSIWLSIFLHFLNNAFVVTQLYIAGTRGKAIDKTMDESMPMWWGIIAVILLAIFLRAFNRETEKLQQARTVQSSPETNV